MPPRRALFTHWLPPLLWMGLIFAGSTDVLSAPHTSRFVVPFLHWLLGTTYTDEKADFIHFLIRKAGHLSEYAVLCVLLWRALGNLSAFAEGRNWLERCFVAAGAATLYATSDEFHQTFTPMRTASVEDVMIDACGAVLGLLIVLGIAKGLRQRNQRSAKIPNVSDKS